MGGKNDKPVIGYHYRPAYHVGLGRGPIDAFLAFAAADKIAWDGGEVKYNASGGMLKYVDGKLVQGEIIPATGPLLASGRIEIGQPNLFGGEKDQGGIVGPVDVMFGEPDQLPNAYLREVFGEQTVAWRGFTTLAFCGGRFGAMNPMPQRPSYKIRKILKGWDGDWGEDPCWYPEKAVVGAIESVLLPAASDGWEYVQIEAHASPGYERLDPPGEGWLTGQAPFGERWTWPGQPAPNTTWTAGTVLWVRRQVMVPAGATAYARIRAENGCLLFVNGVLAGSANRDNVQLPEGEVHDFVLGPGTHELLLKAFDEQPSLGDTYLSVEIITVSDSAMNPAHTLYYVRTDGEKGREPYANINDASLRAAADTLFDEGFGVCWQYDPKQDTPDSFSEHICRIIGGSFTRSLEDGQWYLDLARGDYDVNALPIIGDDDILDFRELPTTLDRAVNSVSVRYFDPARKEKVITPAVRALGLIRMFGEIHQTLDFPEVPTAALAMRIAERELRAYVTPTRTFELVTTPRTRGIRNNQYFRLQSPRRGIADMVCIMGEQDGDTLRSGALRRKVSQDIYGMPEASYVDIEHGVDTRPPQNALAITTAAVFEAPYIAVAGMLPRAELAALPTDVGYLMAVAADPGQHLDYQVAVSADGAGYLAGGTGRWCATALVVEAAGYQDTNFTITNGRHLAAARPGAPVLWGDEICRLDALDPVAGTISLGRGCGDTVAQRHAEGERIWILTEAARGPGEYSEGETVEAKLLSRTATHELPLGDAPALPLEFGSRQARPYPPAGVQINGEAYPSVVVGDVSITASHRDRVLQADQLVDQTVGDIGPEPGTTYTVRNVDLATDTETHLTTGITVWPHVVPAADLAAANRLEVWSVRDGLASWQRVEIMFTFGTALLAEDGSPITAEDGSPIIME